MSDRTLTRETEQSLLEIPILDAHTHLVGGQLGARGLHDILLYHMLISDLYSAGCPNGARLTEHPGQPNDAEAHARIQEAVSYLPRIRNTSCYWGLRIILEDLYDWHEPITARNWERLDGLIRERASDRTAHRAILDRARIMRTGTELARRGDGTDDDRLQYALEWGFFTRCQWGEFDTALYELERCWGHGPESPSPIMTGLRPATERTIETLADVHNAITHYVEHIPFDQVLALATHISTDIDFRPVADEEMAQALTRRQQAGQYERDLYASYVNEAFLTALEPHSDAFVFQFSLGAEPLPFETGARLSQRTIAQLAEMIGRHSQLRFQCFLASRHANQSLCTLARELPNLSLAGYWWHNFFPTIIRQVMAERLDMLPLNQQVGFFSDAYCVEWAYAKAALVRKQMADVLSNRIAQGQFTPGEASSIARAVFYDTPQTLLGMVARTT